MDCVVIGGPASNGLEDDLAEELKAERVKLEHKLFPDGESYLRYPIDVKDKTVILVQSLYPPQDKHLIELLFASDAAKDLGASKVVAVVPYLAYSRQDKRFREGEPISVKTVLKLMRCSGVDAVVTVDIHKEASLSHFGREAVNLSAAEELARYFKGSLRDPLVLAPDEGALRRAEAAARVLGCEHDYLEKRRDRVTGGVKLSPKEVSKVRGRDVLIIDDIISTGGTIALAAKEALRLGASKVVAACTHALLAKGALERMRGAGVEEVVAANTIPSPVSKVSVAKLLAGAVRELLG